MLDLYVDKDETMEIKIYEYNPNLHLYIDVSTYIISMRDLCIWD